MKRLPIVLFMLVILAGLASAVELEVRHEGPSYVQAGAEANFKVFVKNTGYKQEHINIKVDPLATLPSNKFEYIIIDTNKLILNANEEKSFNVKVKLKNTVPTDENYGTYILFTSAYGGDFSQKHNFIMRVVPPEDILDMKVSAPERVEPGRNYELELILENNLNTQLYEVRVAVNSDVFQEERSLRFFALQDRKEKYSFPVGALVEPKEYDLSIRVFYNDEIIERSTVKFSVMENKDVKEKKQESTGFLTKTYSIAKTNYGNAPVEEMYEVQLSSFQRMFADYSDLPALEEDTVQWVFTIEPDSTKVVVATVNYRPLAIVFVVLVIFGFFAYFWLSKTVSVKKQILKVNETKEGITELKILLHIKNKTARTIRHLAVVEILPKVIEPMKGFGTLKPEKIQKGDKGIRLMWVVPELVRGEERIISYKVRSKINIVGSFLLAGAKLRYKNKSGKIVTVESNSVRFTVSSENQ